MTAMRTVLAPCVAAHAGARLAPPTAVKFFGVPPPRIADENTVFGASRFHWRVG